MTDNSSIKDIIKIIIKIYKQHLDTLSNNKKEVEKITGVIFWLSDWLENFNQDYINLQISWYKEIYLRQENIFLCGKNEWLAIVLRLIKNEEQMRSMIKTLIWTKDN